MANMRTPKKDGPGLVFILIALVVVGAIAAKVFGLFPGAKQEPEEQIPKIDETIPPEALEVSMLVYHSHASENFSPGDANTTKGKEGDIVRVGEALVNNLATRGILAVHDVTVHDYPSWSQAYARSKSTIESALQKYPTIQFIIDVHRDGLPDRGEGYTVTKIDGQEAATILLVTGDANNPRAAANLAFAEKIRTKMEQMYPGLLRRIQVKHEDHNGNYLDNSVVVYIGDYRGNTLKQALKSAELLANVLAAVCADLKTAAKE